MEKKSQDFSMEEVMKLAKSPAGQQLMAMLKQQDSNNEGYHFQLSNYAIAQTMGRVRIPNLMSLRFKCNDSPQ